MQALGRAIAERRPVAGLDSTSPLHGLRRRSVGTWDVVAQSIAAIAPAGVVLVNPITMAGRAGSWAFVVMAFTVAMVVLLAAAIAVFARRIASTGSLYTFVTRGLGPVAGIVAGAALGLGYAAIAISTLRGASDRTISLLRQAGLPAEGGGWQAVVVLIFGLLIALIAVRGLRPSTRVMLVIEIVAVVAVVAISAIVLAATGWDLSALVPDGDEPIDPTVLFSAVGVGLIAFVGFESGVALGPESRRPLATVPRALLWTVIAVGAVLLFGAAAQLTGQAAQPEGPDHPELPLVRLGEDAGLAGLGPAVDLIIVLSFFACSLASTTALARLCFVMSRERLLPSLLGRTSQRFGTPAAASVAAVALVVAVPLGWIAATGSAEGSRAISSPASIVGFIVAYLLVSAAAPVFLRRIGEFTWRAALPGIVSALVLGWALGFYLVALEHGTGLAITGGLLAATVLLCLLRAARRPGLLQGLGLYDSPVASDSIGGAAPPVRRS